MRPVTQRAKSSALDGACTPIVVSCSNRPTEPIEAVIKHRSVPLGEICQAFGIDRSDCGGTTTFGEAGPESVDDNDPFFELRGREVAPALETARCRRDTC